MCTGYYNTFLVIEDSGEAFGSAQAKAAILAGCSKSYVLLADGTGVNNNLRVTYSFSAVRAGENEAGFLQTLCFLTCHAVTAAYTVAHFKQHAGKAAHAGACDTNEMNAYGIIPVQKPFA